MSSPLKQNTITIQNLLNKINELPEIGDGVDLPELINEGAAADLMIDKELIDGNGNKITGTFTIDEELTEQDNLIAQITSALEGKASGGSVDTRFADLAMDRLTTIDDETITRFRPYAFYYAENLVSVRLPNAEVSASSVFRNCTNLIFADLPELKGTIGGSIFTYCSNLTAVNIPQVTTINTYAFQYCSSLTRLEIGNVSTIGAGAFMSTGLDTLIIRNTGITIANLTNINALNDTPIANGNGYIYVPNSLIDKFKTHTNWSVFVDQIRAIEDYPEICGG